MQRQGSPALKEQAQKLYLEGLGLRAIGRILGVHHKTLSRWLVQAAGQLPVNQPKTKACSLIEVDELCSFVAKKIKMLDLDSDRFYFWQSAWLCLWQQIDQDGQRAFQAIEGLAYHGLWHRFSQNL